MQLDRVVEANRELLLRRSQANSPYDKLSEREALKRGIEKALDMANFLMAKLCILDISGVTFGDFRILERHWKKILVNQNTGCWEWQGVKTNGGYGMVCYKYKTHIAHRFFYKALVGSIPEGLELDHLCRVRNCVNPNYLEPVTHQENCRRGTQGDWQKQKTHCPQGHEYTLENTYIHSGKRQCKTCSYHRLKRNREAAKDNNNE